MAPAVTIHIRPTAALAERALLPEDPGLAMALAQALLERPLMSNHHRGLWGYTGQAGDGRLLTIQSTGMGGPSAAIVLEELIALGVRRAIRVGTCAALPGAGLTLGEPIVAAAALAADGAGGALAGGRERATGHPRLTAALARAAGPEVRCGLVASTDLFYGAEGTARFTGTDEEWRAAGALAADLESAALLALGACRGIAVACILAVTEIPPGARLDDDAAMAAASERVGRIALGALGARAADRDQDCY